MDVDKKEFMKQMAFEIHKRVVRKFPRRKVITMGKNDVWAGDLVDMSEWKKENDNYKYMLNVIDVFSRYAWSVPLKTKTSKEVLSAFKKIIEENFNNTPKRLWTDKGTEFYNKDFEAFLKSKDINLYSTYGEFKASPVERFNRTLKTIMWKRFTEENTRRWVDMLPELMAEYNDREHSVIKMTPTEAHNLTKEEEKELMKKLYTNLYKEKALSKVKKMKPKFKVGDWVRISRVKGIFEKGYHPNWSQEIFKVVGVGDKFPYVYYLEEFNGDKVEGSFYEQELQKTKYPDTYLVEKTLKTRTVNGRKEHFVKWLGWDNKYNQWIKEDDITFDI